MEFPVQPFQRGFFCNDESIRLPYFEPTVSTTSLYSFGLLIPTLIIFGGEYVHHVLRKDTKLSNRYLTRKHEISNYYRSVFRKLLCFVSGALYGYFISAVGKFTVGRLRPNFIALCGIDLSTVCRDHPYEYITNFTCPNGEFAGNDGRISFPSDHAGFSFYAAVFTVLYLQKRIKCGSLFWKPLLQFLILLLAWWISLTRVMNNQHHMSDVIAGIFIGSGVALINTILVHSFSRTKTQFPVQVRIMVFPAKSCQRHVVFFSSAE
ncbi:putative phosphatidate phosphatase isoform X2 [Planococcus citri]|uniref:putative phosphatidate phosphatase isoform X2 n=1 Tax=Planococcus citri TaxID=170843 RepID=UPI0031F84072